MTRKGKQALGYILIVFLACSIFIPMSINREWALWQTISNIATLIVVYGIACFGYDPFPAKNQGSLTTGQVWMNILSYVMMFSGFSCITNQYGDELWIYFLGEALLMGFAFIQRYILSKMDTHESSENEK